MVVEHAETLTRVKRAINDTSTLDEKTKQKVFLILVRVFKEIVVEEDTNIVSDNTSYCTDSEAINTLRDIFGGKI